MQLTLASVQNPDCSTQIAALEIQSVPDVLRLGGDRFYLVATQGEDRFVYPLQFTRIEAEYLFRLTHKLNWALSPDGFPECQRQVDAIVERAIASGAAKCKRGLDE